MTNWLKVTMKDVAEAKGLVGGPFGSKLVSRDYAEAGVPVIRGQNLSSGRWVSLSDSVYVTQQKAKRDLGGNMAKAGDLVFTQRGTLGQVAIMPADAPPCVISQSQMRLRVDPSKADPAYVYYWSRSPGFRQAISDHAIVAGVPHINLGILGGLPLSLPPLLSQQAIAGVLGTIDDLIENNRRRIEVLEDMARAIYREWFVKYGYPGHGEMDMVDSALGRIPKGWSVQPLKTVATVNGLSRKPVADELFRYLDITALSERYIGELDVIAGSEAPGRARRVVSSGDTVWATVRPNRRAHALLVAPGDDWIASTGLAVLTPTAVSPAFLFETTSTTAFSEWLVGRATGSAYPAVRAKDFEEALVVVPTPDVDRAFADKVTPMHHLSWKLSIESVTLASLRDLLLPKLVTGQIDVSALDLDALTVEQVA